TNKLSGPPEGPPDGVSGRAKVMGDVGGGRSGRPRLERGIPACDRFSSDGPECSASEKRPIPGGIASGIVRSDVMGVKTLPSFGRRPVNANRLLNQLIIPTPCRADWDAMTGDDRVRFCSSCGKHVYNLSAMESDEAEGLLRDEGGKLCARLYRRPDGT